MEKTVSGRLGGRNARKAKRAAALPEDMMPAKQVKRVGASNLWMKRILSVLMILS